MKIDKNKNGEAGQAMVETLVATLALVPLVLVLPHIGKSLDIKGKALETSRYGLLERFTSRETATSSVSQTKSSRQIRREASARIQAEPGTRISSTTQESTSKNSLWNNSAEKALLEEGGIQVDVSMRSDGLLRGAATEALFIGHWTGFSGLMEKFDLPQLDHSRNGKAVVKTSYGISNLPSLGQSGAGDELGQSGSSNSVVKFNDTLVGFTGSWMPDSESDFNARLDSIVLDKGLGLVTDIGCIGGLEFAGLLKEASYCVQNRLTSDSRVIPDRFLDKANKRAK